MLLLTLESFSVLPALKEQLKIYTPICPPVITIPLASKTPVRSCK